MVRLSNRRAGNDLAFRDETMKLIEAQAFILVTDDMPNGCAVVFAKDLVDAVWTLNRYIDEGPMGNIVGVVVPGAESMLHKETKG